MNALIITDIQNDFIPGGALAVSGGDSIIPLVNRLQPYFDVVVATQDWHPANHVSFAANHPGKKPGDEIEVNGLRQVLWPVHCVQSTWGAEFAAGLDRSRVQRVFHKAIDPEIDSYSTFFDNGHRRATGLEDYLRVRGVGDVYLAGLATDYCIKYSALDACGLGLNTYVIEDACRGIELNPWDVNRALSEMRYAGVHVIHSDQVLRQEKASVG